MEISRFHHITSSTTSESPTHFASNTTAAIVKHEVSSTDLYTDYFGKLLKSSQPTFSAQVSTVVGMLSLNLSIYPPTLPNEWPVVFH